jgi:hypothetical protein
LIPNPTERSLAAQVAAHESWAKTPDRPARTRNARQALEAKFLAEADGDPVRAQSIRKAYYARLALKSVQSRRKAAEARAQANRLDREAAEAEAAMGDVETELTRAEVA